jgi:hypothetical protein
LCRVELRQERSDLFFGIDDLDDSGEIARRIDAEFVIDPIAVAVAQRPMENSCACEPCLERRLNARLARSSVRPAVRSIDPTTISMSATEIATRMEMIDAASQIDQASQTFVIVKLLPSEGAMQPPSQKSAQMTWKEPL